MIFSLYLAGLQLRPVISLLTFDTFASPRWYRNIANIAVLLFVLCFIWMKDKYIYIYIYGQFCAFLSWLTFDWLDLSLFPPERRSDFADLALGNEVGVCHQPRHLMKNHYPTNRFVISTWYFLSNLNIAQSVVLTYASEALITPIIDC